MDQQRADFTISKHSPSRFFLRAGRPPRSGPTSRPSVAAAVAEAVAALRELETVAFQLSRNSATGLFFAQQKLVLLRLANGKPPTRDELARLAGSVCSPAISSELQEGAA